MVKNLSISGDELHGPNPDVFVEVEFDRDVAVIDDARGGDRLSSDLERHVRVAEAVLGIVEGQRRQRVFFPLVPRGPRVDPVDQRLLLLCREPVYVAHRLADMRVDLAGRHATGHDDFAHHQ